MSWDGGGKDDQGSEAGIKLLGGKRVASEGDPSGGRKTGHITGFGGGRFGSGGGSGRAGGRVVVKGNYTRTKSAGGLKASARYYATRANEHGEKMEREAFGQDRGVMNRDDVNVHLEGAVEKHEVHYRMVLSPGTDQEGEGVDLKAYARDVLQEYGRGERGDLTWVGFAHAGETAHTGRAHVHLIVSLDRQLDAQDFAQFREDATTRWETAKAPARLLQRDAAAGRDVQDMGASLERARGADRSDGRGNEAHKTDATPADEDATRSKGRGRGRG